MGKITLNNETERKVKAYANKHKISFQKACEKLFDIGVCHLAKSQKKDSEILEKNTRYFLNSFDMGVCHPCRIRKITIIKVEMA